MNSLNLLIVIANLCSIGTPCEFSMVDKTHIFIERGLNRGQLPKSYYCIVLRKTTGEEVNKIYLIKPPKGRPPDNREAFEICITKK